MIILRRLTLILMPLFLLFSVTFLQTFNLDYYTEQFKSNHIVEETGIGADQLDQVALEIIRYLSGLQDSLVFDVSDLKGNRYQAFEERELIHMEDVKKIFNVIRIFLIFYLIALLASLYDVYRKKQWKVWFITASKHVVYPSLVMIFVLFAAMTIDFNGAFIVFHKLLFRNDLWLLDPTTDLLIQMLPEIFFVTIAKRILLWFSSFIILGGICLGWVHMKERK